MRKKEYEKLKKYQGLNEELEVIWKVKAKVVIGTLRSVTPKVGE